MQRACARPPMPTGQDARKLAHRAGATATTDRKVNKKTPCTPQAGAKNTCRETKGRQGAPADVNGKKTGQAESCAPVEAGRGGKTRRSGLQCGPFRTVKRPVLQHGAAALATHCESAPCAGDRCGNAILQKRGLQRQPKAAPLQASRSRPGPCPVNPCRCLWLRPRPWLWQPRPWR